MMPANYCATNSGEHYSNVTDDGSRSSSAGGSVEIFRQNTEEDVVRPDSSTIGSPPEQTVPSIYPFFPPPYHHSPIAVQQGNGWYHNWQREPPSSSCEFGRPSSTRFGGQSHPQRDIGDNSAFSDKGMGSCYPPKHFMSAGAGQTYQPGMQIQGYTSPYPMMSFFPSPYNYQNYSHDHSFPQHQSQAICLKKRHEQTRDKEPAATVGIPGSIDLRDTRDGCVIPPERAELITDRAEDGSPTLEQEEDRATRTPPVLPPLNEMIVLPTKASVFLCNRELWLKFNEHVTEMIVTKQGRRMFPHLSFRFTGLERETEYNVLVDMVLADPNQWKFSSGKWSMCGPSDGISKSSNVYVHPDSPATGAYWMKNEVIFSKIKLTNHKGKNENFVALNSMHKYQPRIHVLDVTNQRTLQTHSFKETQFFAVTAYQNTDITQLKIDYNPFAKGFRDGYASFATHGNTSANRGQPAQSPENLLTPTQSSTSPPNRYENGLFNLSQLVNDRSRVPVATIHHHQVQQTAFPPFCNQGCTTGDSFSHPSVAEQFQSSDLPLSSPDSTQNIGPDGHLNSDNSSLPSNSFPRNTQSNVMEGEDYEYEGSLGSQCGDDEVFRRPCKRQRLGDVRMENGNSFTIAEDAILNNNTGPMYDLTSVTAHVQRQSVGSCRSDSGSSESDTFLVSV